jgi:CubicO group peptidase (beta-lactamase class C family)
MCIYFDGLNVFEHAVNQPLELAPNTQWRYRNSDPLTLGKIIRETVEARGPNGIEAYLTFPQRVLFDAIGARNFVLETDAWGNFIMTGYDYGSARDWARFGLLHLWDGVWEGRRILPEGWVEFISTPAPADNSRGYGGLFWLNRSGAWQGVPEDAFMSSGFMGQHTVVIRSRDAVVVRLGPSPGDSTRHLTELLNRLLAGLPKQ